MFCTRCGLAVEEGTRFCKSCGQEAGVRPTTAPVVTPAAPTPVIASAPPPPQVVAAAPIPVYIVQPYGGFWARLVALLIDQLILGIPLTFIAVILVFLMGGFAMIGRRAASLSGLPPNEVNPQVVMATFGPLLFGYFLVLILFLIAGWLYFAGMESSERQATFGKAAMSLRVTSTEGQRLSFGHASGRYFAKLITGLIPFAIGWIMAGFTAKKQALHDMIAGTLVMKR